MNKNKKIGWFLILGPICLLILIFVLSVLATSMLSPCIQNVNGELRGCSTPISARVIIGILAILDGIGIIIGMPLGVYFLFKKD